MVSTLHPHLLHALSALFDAVSELAPEEPCLDVAASVLVTSQMSEALKRLTSLPCLTTAHIAWIAAVERDVVDAEDALSAASERHRDCLAAMRHTVRALHDIYGQGHPASAALTDSVTLPESLIL